MLGSIRRRLAFVMAVALASCTGVAPAVAQHKVVHAAAEGSKPGKRGLFNGMPIYSSARYGRKGAGISMAQQQRTSRKSRGIARNRRHHR